MQRRRPQEHPRRLQSGKKVIVNKGVNVGYQLDRRGSYDSNRYFVVFYNPKTKNTIRYIENHEYKRRGFPHIIIEKETPNKWDITQRSDWFSNKDDAEKFLKRWMKD